MAMFLTNAGLQYLLENGLLLQGNTVFDGVLTLGSNVVENVSSFEGLQPGQFVSGTGIPPNTYILDTEQGSDTLTLSNQATASTPSGQTTVLTASGMISANLPLTCHLLQAPPVIGRAATFAQQTEANFDGYAPQQLSYPLVATCPDGENVIAAGGLLEFIPLDFALPQNIYGLCLTFQEVGSTTPTLFGVEAFQTSRGIQEPGDAVRVVPVISIAMDQTAGYPSQLL
jgi:hypothetical protein